MSLRNVNYGDVAYNFDTGTFEGVASPGVMPMDCVDSLRKTLTSRGATIVSWGAQGANYHIKPTSVDLSLVATVLGAD